MKKHRKTDIIGPRRIVEIPLDQLKPYTHNARTHSRHQIKQIARSIKKFGMPNPILATRDGVIIAGHCRYMAVKELAWETAPVLFIDGWSEAEINAYRVADNKIAERAGWDEEIMKIELENIQLMQPDFDLTFTGLETPEIDILLMGAGEGAEPGDEVPEIDPNKTPVSKLGDLWILDRHRILCGDALISRNYRRLMREKLARMVITDPPYNVPIDGYVSGFGKIKHEEFAMASGEMSTEEFVAFLRQTFKNLAAFSMEGSLHYIFIDWRHAWDVQMASQACYSELKNICVWNKDKGGMGSLYRSKHEFVFVFKKGSAPHINNIQLGRHGRYRTNVWDYAGQNTFHKYSKEELVLHPTVKPVAMIADAILDCSKRGSIILDCFGGSGSSLIAAEKTGRRARLMELDPRYVDCTIRRWQEMTGKDAVHRKTGKTFNQLERESKNEHE